MYSIFLFFFAPFFCNIYIYIYIASSVSCINSTQEIHRILLSLLSRPPLPLSSSLYISLSFSLFVILFIFPSLVLSLSPSLPLSLSLSSFLYLSFPSFFHLSLKITLFTTPFLSISLILISFSSRSSHSRQSSHSHPRVSHYMFRLLDVDYLQTSIRSRDRGLISTNI